MLEKGIVYQANPLVEAIKYESIDENRLFLACLKKLNPHLPTSKYFDDDFKDIVIPTQEIIDFFGGNDYYYTELAEIAKKLLGTYIFIEDKEIKTFRGYTVFEYIEFGKKFGGLHFKFTSSMKPFLLDLYNKGFTGINLKEVFVLRSSYSLRILELLLQYKGLADNEGKYERSFSFDKLRLILNISTESYKRPSSFLKDIIKSPVSAINKKTRYVVNYIVQRKGKKAIGVTFQVTLPKDMQTIDITDTNIIKSKPKSTKKEEIPLLTSATATSEKNISLDITKPIKEDLPTLDTLAEMPEVKTERKEEQEPKKTKKKLEDYTKEEAYALAKLLRFKITEKVAFATLEKYGAKAINWAVKDFQAVKNRGVIINNPAGFILDKIAEYDESEVTAEDILKLVEKFEEDERQEQMRQKEEADRLKAKERAKEEEENKARLEIRSKYSEEELTEVKASIYKDYVDNNKTFNDEINAEIKKYGLRSTEIMSFALLQSKNNVKPRKKEKIEKVAENVLTLQLEPLDEDFVSKIKADYVKNKMFAPDTVQLLEQRGWTVTKFMAKYMLNTR